MFADRAAEAGDQRKSNGMPVLGPSGQNIGQGGAVGQHAPLSPKFAVYPSARRGTRVEG
jgi:hypothetical protein